MIVKRIINTDSCFQPYIKESGLRVEKTESMGLVPIIEKDHSELRPFIELLAGRYMGANARKGLTWNWLLSHIRDGKGVASPRPLLLLIERAAQIESSRPRAVGSILLHPIALRQALDEVAQQECNSARELPWLKSLKDKLNGLETPLLRSGMLDAIRPSWKVMWKKASIPSPADTADEFIERLVEWGIVSRRDEKRIDVPDLYRAGLGMIRRGGVSLGR